jgi:hypothetical protein
MAQAIIGLVGVVIGGVLTGGVDFVLERRREKRRGRAAARLIHAELSDIAAYVEASLLRRAWLADPAGALEGESWKQWRAALAEAPGFEGWYPISGAWGWISQLGQILELLGEGAGADPLDDKDLEFFKIGLLQLAIADKALSDYAKTKSYSDPPNPDAPSSAEQIDALLNAAMKVD